MTTPTPTESDKRAAKRIIGVYAEFDLESVAQTGRIIAEEMAAEREALRLAKEWLQRIRGSIRGESVNELADEALAAIEKVEG